MAPFVPADADVGIAIPGPRSTFITPFASSVEVISPAPKACSQGLSVPSALTASPVKKKGCKKRPLGFSLTTIAAAAIRQQWRWWLCLTALMLYTHRELLLSSSSSLLLLLFTPSVPAMLQPLISLNPASALLYSLKGGVSCLTWLVVEPLAWLLLLDSVVLTVAGHVLWRMRRLKANSDSKARASAGASPFALAAAGADTQAVSGVRVSDNFRDEKVKIYPAPESAPRSFSTASVSKVSSAGPVRVPLAEILQASNSSSLGCDRLKVGQEGCVGGVPATAEATATATATAAASVVREAWPRVLVQLPMYNEREVYARAIAKACQLAWPRGRLVVQVLDDSTEVDVSDGMRACVLAWQARGVDVRYRHRVDRRGYKAGNLREGLGEGYAQACKYVAVLDADFEPAADWLQRCVPHLEKDPRLALVQTRWTYSNERECLLTRLQEVELSWHFLAEQLVSSAALQCFGFNGTAGVWRTAAIRDAGNWRDDTTVEDMDMAVCAAVRGWRMLMVPEVECPSELPATYAAYRKQQRRWTSGPASLLRQRFASIMAASGCAMGWPCKAYIVGCYILLRRAARHAVGIMLWCVLLPCWLLLPMAARLLGSGGGGAAVGAAVAVAGSALPFPLAAVACMLVHPLCLWSLSNPGSNSGGGHGGEGRSPFCWEGLKESLGRLSMFPAYCFFLSGMLPLRASALLAGLLDLSSSRTWDVTQKLGAARGIGSSSGGGSVEQRTDSRPEGCKLETSSVGGGGIATSAAVVSVDEDGEAVSSSERQQHQGCVALGRGSRMLDLLRLAGRTTLFVPEICMGVWLLCVGSLATSGFYAREVSSGAAVLQWGVIAWMLCQACWNIWVGVGGRVGLMV